MFAASLEQDILGMVGERHAAVVGAQLRQLLRHRGIAENDSGEVKRGWCVDAWQER